MNLHLNLNRFMLRMGLLVLFAFTMTAWCLAQTVTPEPLPLPMPGWGLPEWLSWYTALYGFLIILITYLSNWIPFLKKITEVRLRVIVIAGVGAVIFFVNGKAGFWDLIAGFATATGFYTYILKWFFPTPGGSANTKQLETNSRVQAGSPQ